MSNTTFAEIIEAVAHLLPDQQETLIKILQNRLLEQKRAELIKDIQQAQQELVEGKYHPVTPAQLMEEILK